MINKEQLKELHIGEMIKNIARKKEISSRDIANTLSTYRQNSDKIFRMDDMNIEDLIRISYLFKHNFLHYIVKEFIPHLSFSVSVSEPDNCLKAVDMESTHFIDDQSTTNCDFLNQILVGVEIKKVADKNNWNGQKVAEILNCTPAMLCYLYHRKSVRVKKLLEVSDAFQYDFISNVYLSRICI